MERWREQYLGLAQFPATMSAVVVEQFFTLNDAELAAVARRRRLLNRLSVALQIGFLRMTGRTLNSCQMLPAAVLEHLGTQLHLTPPLLASIRALYRRRRTLFDHQHVAMDALGFRDFTEHAKRALTAHLRRAAVSMFSREGLIRRARVWLYEHRYVLPGDKRIAELVRTSSAHLQRQLVAAITTRIDDATRATWIDLLSRRHGDTDVTVLDWLREPPGSRKHRDIAEQLEKVALLRRLGADRLQLPEVSERRVGRPARPLHNWKPSHDDPVVSLPALAD